MDCKNILLFQCLLKDENKSNEHAFVRYMGFVPSPDEVDETLWCLCLQ